MPRINLLTLDLWAIHEQNTLEVLQGALQNLARSKQLPQRENDLNRALLMKCKAENIRLRRLGRGVSAPFVGQCPNQPTDERVVSPSESKIPDFQVGLVDGQMGRDRFFSIEAKRLGERTKSGWDLNQEYACSGVDRFVDPEWSYGAGEPCGAMVGYIQSMACDDILEAVNTHGGALGHAAVTRCGPHWVDRGVSQLGQQLTRTIRPAKFALSHFWVDVRHCNAKTKRKARGPKGT